MSEAMAVEELIDAYWQLNGYWTKIRYSVQTDNHAWMDFDVLAYNPKDNELVICESKVKGRKNDIPVYLSVLEKNGVCLEDFDNSTNGQDYLSFTKHINKKILGKVFDDLNVPKETKISIHFVSNYYIENDILDNCKKELRKMTEEKNDLNGFVIDRIIINTTFEVFCEIIKIEKENGQGKRYGNNIIDIAREINRYMNPTIKFQKIEKVRKIEGIQFPKNRDYKCSFILKHKRDLYRVLKKM